MQVTLIVNGVHVITTLENQDQTNQTNAQQLQATVRAQPATLNALPAANIIAAVDATALVDMTMAAGIAVS